MTTKNEEWLALTKESPIDPELPICDPHHHLWDRPDDRYLLEEFLRDTAGGHNIVQTVFVECKANYRQNGPQEIRPIGETEFIQNITAQSGTGQYGRTRAAAGIVGFADLTLGYSVKPILKAHIKAGKGRFRGIRHTVSWNKNSGAGSSLRGPELLLDPKFREGLVCLQEYGLSFDVTIYHPQLMELVNLAEAFPNMPIILDHTGGPRGIERHNGKRDEMFREWKNNIAALASCSNIVVKLGGLGMPFCGFDWLEKTTPPSSVELANDMAPYYHWCIEHFGAERCMFESNFPVDKISYSYTVMWNAFKRLSQNFSPQERAALFHDTSVRVYNLDTNNKGN